jgi:UPF0755 protein
VDERGVRAVGEVSNGPGRRAPVVRRRRWAAAILTLAVVVLVLAAIAVGWYRGQEHRGQAGPAVVVGVPAGASMGTVTDVLARQHVIGSSLAFRINLVLNGTPVVQPGRYRLRRDEDFGSVRAALSSGPDVFPVDVPPGYTVAEVAREVDDVPGHTSSHFLATVRSGSVPSPWLDPTPGLAYGMDGLLGTGQYLVLPGETDAELLGHMVERFDATARSVRLSEGADALGMSPYQAITAASIVQKEAISPGDSASATARNAPRVARVVLNRLAQGKPLQVDSTVLYAEGRDGGTVTAGDLALDSPYNTYEHTGLTPTPICFPSRLALTAALHPAPGSWLYFVLTSRDGAETFSDTFAEQKAAEKLAASRGLP